MTGIERRNPTRRLNVNERDRYRRAVRAVWERSFRDWEQWSEVSREAARPAVEALLAQLAEAPSEEALLRQYWEAGDAPGKVLRPRLPAAFDEDDLLTLEEACFWMRLQAIEGQGRP